MTKRRASKNNVIILWMRQHNDELQTLAYNGGNGPIRVYVKDCYDPRCNMGATHRLPHFTDGAEAAEWCLQNRNKQCQLRESAGRKIFKGSDFAEPEAFAMDNRPEPSPTDPKGTTKPKDEAQQPKPDEGRHLSVVPTEGDPEGRAA